MTNKEAKDFLTHYICSCPYGNSPADCGDNECKFGVAIRTLCVDERPHGEWIPTVIDTGLFERAVCREWQCSNCVEVVKMKYPFCHCGADMRKAVRKND